MTMDTWATIWATILVLVAVVFAIVSVGVTVGGFRDVKAMFSSLDDQHEEDQPNE